MKAIYHSETRIWSSLLVTPNENEFGSVLVQVPIEYAAGYKPGDIVDLEEHHNKMLKFSVLGQLRSRNLRRDATSKNEVDIKKTHKIKFERESKKEIKSQNEKVSNESKSAFIFIVIIIAIIFFLVIVLGEEATTWIVLLAVPFYILLKSIGVI